MRLTPESRAVVEAAINTLSAPRPVGMLDGPAGTMGPQPSGDTRTVEQRRGDALVDVCRRAVTLGLAATAADGGERTTPDAVVPLGVKATVLVTIGYDDLAPGPAPAPWSVG